MKAKIHKFVQNGTYILLDINCTRTVLLNELYSLSDEHLRILLGLSASFYILSYHKEECSSKCCGKYPKIKPEECAVTCLRCTRRDTDSLLSVLYILMFAYKLLTRCAVIICHDIITLLESYDLMACELVIVIEPEFDSNST